MTVHRESATQQFGQGGILDRTDNLTAFIDKLSSKFRKMDGPKVVDVLHWVVQHHGPPPAPRKRKITEIKNANPVARL
ncbi:MAG: hypothetical protein QM795_13390 [Pseudoxanthomonas sp.]